MTMRPLYCFTAVLVLCACAEKPSAPAPKARAPFATPSQPVQAPRLPALTLDGYKREVAGRIAARSAHMFTEPLPERFKSNVVLDITIGRDGALERVVVRRSNGFKQLEARA